MDPTFFDHEWIETKALSMWYLLDMIIGKPTVLGCFWSWNNWQTWNTLNTKESIRNPWKSCWNALSMSINAPCSCIKMFYSVTTKQTELCHHTQISCKVKIEGGPSETGKSESSADGSQVLIIFAALTVSSFVTKNDVKSYQLDILIVRCMVPTYVDSANLRWHKYTPWNYWKMSKRGYLNLLRKDTDSPDSGHQMSNLLWSVTLLLDSYKSTYNRFWWI